MERAERIRGGLWGLLVADAVGVPYEFKPAALLPPLEALEPEPPPGWRRAHPVPTGTFSDDGAHALCLAASLLERGRLDPDDLGQRLVRWRDQGYLAVDAVVFDVGIQTDRAVARLRAGVPAVEAGAADERSNGNGALMRVLPLALWHHGDDAALVADAALQSRVTHGHPRSQAACALYCLWARRLLEAHPKSWEDAVATLRRLGPAVLVDELETHLRPDEPPVRTGSGYVVHTVGAARHALAAGSYEQVVKAAIALGDDTDTNAAVAGGLAGVRDGERAIPPRWRQILRGVELAAPLVEALARRAA